MPKQQDPEQAHEPSGAYVYYSYEEWGRGYIGSRCSQRHRREPYLGSFSDTTFEPTDKIILFEGTAEECLEVEVTLHEFFDVARNPHFANRARQTSTGFTTFGMAHSEETKARISAGTKGRVFSDETKQLMSENNYSHTEKAKASKRGEQNPMRRPEVAAKCKGNKSRTGMTNTSESNEARRKAMTGRKVSEKTRQRMSEAAKRRKRKE